MISGFHIIFQDVDLIWMRNPVPYLMSLKQYDIMFMDDGVCLFIYLLNFYTFISYVQLIFGALMTL